MKHTPISCIAGGALAVVVALSAHEASAGPLNAAKPPPPKIPRISHVSRSVAADQQELSFWGMRTVIQQKRDRVHRALGARETHARTSNY